MSEDCTYWVRPLGGGKYPEAETKQETERAVPLSLVQGQQWDGNLRFVVEIKGIGAKPYPALWVARELLGVLQDALDAGAGATLGYFPSLDLEVGLFELGRD